MKGKSKKLHKLNWYDIILIISIIVVVFMLIISKEYKINNPWLSNLLTSLATSLLFGAVLSYIFAYLNERNTVINGVKRELTEIVRGLMIFQVNLNSIWNRNKKEKVILSIPFIENLPHLFDIQRLYPKFRNEYYEFRRSIVEKIKEIENFSAIIYEISVMADKTLKLQELFYQEYLGDKKMPIGGQAVFILNDPIDDYGANYSNKKRKFKKKDSTISNK